MPQYYVRTPQLVLGLLITLLGFYVMLKFDTEEYEQYQAEVLTGSIFLICAGCFIGLRSRIPVQ